MELDSFCGQMQKRLFRRSADVLCCLSLLPGVGAQLWEAGKGDQET
jgi:hypothetical protein